MDKSYVKICSIVLAEIERLTCTRAAGFYNLSNALDWQEMDLLTTSDYLFFNDGIKDHTKAAQWTGYAGASGFC